jgi:hypothetical protein
MYIHDHGGSSKAVIYIIGDQRIQTEVQYECMSACQQLGVVSLRDFSAAEPLGFVVQLGNLFLTLWTFDRAFIAQACHCCNEAANQPWKKLL